MPFKKGSSAWNKTNTNSVCKLCGTIFHIPPSRLTDTKIKRGVYCSRKCSDKSKVGKPSWNSSLKGEEYKKHYKKGFGGTFYSVGSIFKGSREEYMGLHYWVRKTLGSNPKCEICGKEFSGKKIQWANKSGEYQKEISDWIRLCTKCHFIYDETKRGANKKLGSSS